MSNAPNLPKELLQDQINLQEAQQGCSSVTPKSLLTIVEHLYHITPYEPVVEVSSRFSIKLEDGEEQPYTRHLTAKDKWEAIDIGWIKSPSMVVIINREGSNPQKIQSKAELKLLKQDKTLRITYISPSEKPVGYLLVPPGEALRFQPHNIKHLCIRCAVGTAKYILHAFPK